MTYYNFNSYIIIGITKKKTKIVCQFSMVTLSLYNVIFKINGIFRKQLPHQSSIFITYFYVQKKIYKLRMLLYL